MGDKQEGNIEYLPQGVLWRTRKEYRMTKGGGWGQVSGVVFMLDTRF